MNKKIIALALVFVLMVTVFTACKKKYETTHLYGKDYILVTDADGNTRVNEDNHLIAMVTNKDGEVVTYESGEEQTFFVEVYGDILNNGKTYGDYGEFAIPKGWETDDYGNLFKKDSDNNCTIKLLKAKELEEKELVDTYGALESYLTTIDEQNNALMEELKKQGYQVEYLNEEVSLTSQNLRSKGYTYKILDDKGSVIHYAENYYFVADDTIFKLEYACLNGVGYDESFDFKAYVNSGFVFGR